MDSSLLDPLEPLLSVLVTGASMRRQVPGNPAMEDAYQELKTLLKKKGTDLPHLPALLSQLEHDPDVPQNALKEALAHMHATRDATILQAVGKLLTQQSNKQGVAMLSNVNTGVQWFAQCRFENSTITFYFLDGSHGTVPFLAPRQPPYNLIGRSALLHDLKDQLFRRKNLALNGLPGVGKTALAIALAHDPEVLNHFSDGILWAGLGREADEIKVLSLLGNWGTALEISPSELGKMTDIASRRERISAAIGQRNMLLVADDAWSPDIAKHFNIGGPHCAYLLTTRFPSLALDFTGEGAQVVQELKLDDGLLLLRQFVPHVVDAEPEKAQELFKAVDGLPLALILMGRYLRREAYSGQSRRLQHALDQLQQIEERLRLAQSQIELKVHPSLSEHVPISLWAVIEISDRALNEAARQQLQTLSVFPAKPNTFSEAAAVAVSTLPARALDTLTDSGLLESSGSGRYMLHQRIADYAKVTCTDAAVEGRMVEFFARYVEEHETAYEVLEAEASNMNRALQLAWGQQMREAIVRGTNAYYPFLESRGLYRQAEEYLKRAHDAATILEDRVGLATVWLNEGKISEKKGAYEQAERSLREGLTLARQLDHQERISALLNTLGVVTGKRGNYEQAESSLQEGLTLARQIGNPERISALLQTLGEVATHRGNYEQAESSLQEGLELARQLSHHLLIASILCRRGDLYLKTSQSNAASETFRQALEIVPKESQEVTAEAQFGLARVEALLGNAPQARQWGQTSLSLFEKIGHQKASEVREWLAALPLPDDIDGH